MSKLKVCDPNKPLSDKHKAVIQHYFENGKKSKKAAYLHVYDCSEDSAEKAASNLFKKLEIHPEYIEIDRDFRDRSGITRQYIVNETLNILLKCTGEKTVWKRYRDKEGNIVEMETRVFQPIAALNAIAELNKMFGFYKETEMKLKLEGAARDGVIRIANIELE